MERYPISGELLLQEIDKLPEEDKKKLDYRGICEVISQEIATRALKEEIQLTNERSFEEIRREVAWQSGEMVD